MMNNVEEETNNPLHGYYKREVGRLHDFAHEAKHCYQFETGYHSFNSKGYSGLLYDLTDEIEAHYRGFVFGAENEKPNSSYYRLEKKSIDLNNDVIRHQFKSNYNRNMNTDYYRYDGKTYNPNRTR